MKTCRFIIFREKKIKNYGGDGKEVVSTQTHFTNLFILLRKNPKIFKFIVITFSAAAQYPSST